MGKNDNIPKSSSAVQVTALTLAIIALIAAKFLWAFTLWYEWIALGVALIFGYIATVAAGTSHRHNKHGAEDEGDFG